MEGHNIMNWSMYNTLFQSNRFGYFLYNALSNSLIELDEKHYRSLEEIKNAPDEENHLIDPGFSVLLREKNILVENGVERQLLLARQHRRNTVCYDTSRLDLTICPTLGCNFRCLYCFEHSQNDMTVMSPSTIDRLMQFIKSFAQPKRLSVSWYGGEPTLAFGVIKEITEKLKTLDITFENARMVTNGYLLDSEKISQMNELKIRSVQITLDGAEAVHNTRRVHAGGQPTYQHIMERVDLLMNSDYTGSCNIRVNVDRNNAQEFLNLRAALLECYKGKKLTVYASYVHTARAHKYNDRNCQLCSQEWSDYILKLFHQQGIRPIGGFYPDIECFNTCTANSINGFVVGPKGELYKCWADVGIPQMVIGTILEENHLTNPGLVAAYATGTDPHLDRDCLACSTLPICGGGCANKRLRSKQLHEEGLEFCSPHKDNLIPYLEAYYDGVKTREICSNLLEHSRTKESNKGYRLIENEKKKQANHPLDNPVGNEDVVRA